MMPDGSITKPEPSEETLRARGPPSLPFFLKNSSKNSSNGEPGGSCGICTPFCASIVCEVEIFTTASITRSAISATESGPLPEAANPGLAASAASPAAKPSAAAERKELLNSVDMTILEDDSAWFSAHKLRRKTRRNKMKPNGSIHFIRRGNFG